MRAPARRWATSRDAGSGHGHRDRLPSIEEPKDPEQDLVFGLYQLIAPPEDAAQLADRYRAGGLRYVDAKRRLAEVLIDQFDNVRSRYRELLDDPAELERVLTASAESARSAAAETLDQVKATTGIGPTL